ncbi:integrase [Methanococcoides vulcani]|uniref:integrase n=1 Tax=Methanococcoides vulcani TaxID=1353158 RepID=UPI002452A88E|nr:integrase [Methanococcoides vulcani]
MTSDGIMVSIADFIQGRAATTVGSAHYLNKVKQAKTEYHKIVGNLCCNNVTILPIKKSIRGIEVESDIL